MANFCIDWYAGASAQIELIRQPALPDRFQLRYVSPFRPTLRIPADDVALSEEDLRPTNAALNQFVVDADSRAAGTVVTADTGVDLTYAGQALFELVVPGHVQADLRVKSLFLEMGVDEQLVKYPWELMNDGQDYLCMKHSFGRFVNIQQARLVPGGQGTSWIGTPVDEITVLLVGVDMPLPRDGQSYARLPGALTETIAVSQLLAGIPGVKVEPLVGVEATWENVFRRLNAPRKYHILHFSGHASTAGLVLHDRNMTTKQIEKFVNKNSPILCFVNACESGQTQSWQTRYDIFDVARAFLETGAYLLGSRWKISDHVAAQFAPAFYKALIQESKPIGTAVQEARIACRTARPDSFAWASYVFYGDPRLQLRVA